MHHVPVPALDAGEDLRGEQQVTAARPCRCADHRHAVEFGAGRQPPRLVRGENRRLHVVRREPGDHLSYVGLYASDVRGNARRHLQDAQRRSLTTADGMGLDDGVRRPGTGTGL